MLFTFLFSVSLIKEFENRIRGRIYDCERETSGRASCNPGSFPLGRQKVTPLEMEFTEAGKFLPKQLCSGRGRLLGKEEETCSGLWSVPERELKRRKRRICSMLDHRSAFRGPRYSRFLCPLTSIRNKKRQLVEKGKAVRTVGQVS